MIRSLAAALLLTLPYAVASAQTCSGAHPAIAAVAVKSMQTQNGLNQYTLSGTVVNNGSDAQPAGVLQSVDIYQGTQKLDSRSIPPLRAGQSYAFSYVSQRSADAGRGTTKLTFKLDPSPGTQACGGGLAVASVSF